MLVLLHRTLQQIHNGIQIQYAIVNRNEPFRHIHGSYFTVKQQLTKESTIQTPSWIFFTIEHHSSDTLQNSLYSTLTAAGCTAEA